MSKLGYCSLGIYEKSLPDSLSLQEKIRIFRECGYDCFELSIDESSERLARVEEGGNQAETLIKIMRDADFYARSICLSGNRKYPIGNSDPDIREKGILLIKKTIDFALKTGIRVILIPGYDTYYEPSTDKTLTLFEQALFDVTAYAAGKGVILALENIETPFMNTVEKSVSWVRRINSPFLQCYTDAGNMEAAQIPDPVGQVFLAEGHIAGMHLKDGKPGMFKNVIYGEGNIDFNRLFSEIRKRNMSFPCIAEVNTLSDVNASVENIKYVRSFLENAYQNSK